MDPTVTVIVPFFNEENALPKVLKELKALNRNYEVILVDDGSTDKSYMLAERSKLKIVRHHRNKGYGASLKSGAKKAKGDLLVFFDGDGQHKTEGISKLVESIKENDLVIGQRINQRKVAPMRAPAKFILNRIANYLTGEKILDLNSGFRIIKRKLFLRFMHLFPDGFSCSTTMTIFFSKFDYKAAYCPITIRRRYGRSTVNPLVDGYNTILLIMRLIALFDPLRIFSPVAISLIVSGFAYGFYKLLRNQFGFTVGALLLSLSGVVIFFFGILCDQVSSPRLHKFIEHDSKHQD